MGRFICIGIIHKIRVIDPGSFNPEQLYPLFSRDLFDYSSFNDGSLSIRPDIPMSDLYDLSKEVMDICDTDSDLSFDSFRQDCYPCHLTLGEMNLNLTIYCLLFWQSPYKFYPGDGGVIHEINLKLDGLIHYCLGENRLKSLIKSYISL